MVARFGRIAPQPTLSSTVTVTSIVTVPVGVKVSSQISVLPLIWLGGGAEETNVTPLGKTSSIWPLVRPSGSPVTLIS